MTRHEKAETSRVCKARSWARLGHLVDGVDLGLVLDEQLHHKRAVIIITFATHDEARPPFLQGRGTILRLHIHNGEGVVDGGVVGCKFEEGWNRGGGETSRTE